MQRCQFCGFEFPENARFCGNCGRAPVLNAPFSDAPSPANFAPQAFMPPPVGNQPDAEDEEEWRDGAILPIPVPPLPGASFAGGQVPQVAGAPSFSGVPGVAGTPSSMAGPFSPPSTPFPAGFASPPPPPSTAYQAGSAPSPFAPPNVSPVGQPGVFEQPMPPWNNAPVAHQAGTAGPQYPWLPPDQNAPGKGPHRHHQHHERHGRRAASKLLAGGSTKLILIAIIALLIVAGGVLAFTLRTQSPSPAGATPVTTSKGTPSSSHTASASASPTAATGHAAGTFNFAGAIPGLMVITSLPQCGVRGGNYGMKVIGTVGGTQYNFLIGILSYHGPGTYTSNLTVNLIKVGTFVSLNNDGRLPVTITVTNNGKAGTVSSDLVGIVNPTSPQPATGHVSGSWTCA